jgi:hypothetical protein
MTFRLLAVFLLLSLACAELQPSDFIGEYRGFRSSGNEGVLRLLADGRFEWQPAVRSTAAAPQEGTYRVRILDGEWRLTLEPRRPNGEIEHVESVPFLVVMGRIRTITFDDDRGYFLTRQ